MNDLKRKIFLNPYAPLGVWFLFLLVMMTIARWVFFIVYGSFENLLLLDTWKAFFMGFRFDLSASAHIIMVPLLFFLFTKWIFVSRGGQKLFVKLQTTLLLGLTVFVVGLVAIDVGYYSYFNDRLNILLFGFFEDDTLALLKTFWQNYPVLLIVSGFGLFVWLMGIFCIWISRRSYEISPGSLLRFYGWGLGLMLTLGVFARGTLSLFPLGVADTTISDNAFVNTLAYNGLHAFYRAAQLRVSQSLRWDLTASAFGIKTVEEAIHQATSLPKENNTSTDSLSYFSSQLPVNTWAESARPHVILIVNESMGGHALIDQDDKNFDLLGRLKRHIHEDYWWDRFLPSMTATIGSLSALMINTPHRPWGGFLTESYSLGTKFRTSPARVFNAAGYETHFVYGGAVGWRDIDKFARNQGFEKVEGEGEIKKSLGRELRTHPWGIDDRDLMDYLLHTLSRAKEPLFLLVMTTGNHPPFELPYLKDQEGIQQLSPNLQRRLIIDPEIAKLRMRAYAYANDQLGRFMDELKSSAQKNNTVVGITGDHGFLIENFQTTEMLKKWSVPFYLYVPEQGRSQAHFHPDTLGSHEDIFPTIYRRALSNQTVYEFGDDMLSENALIQSTAMHFSQFILTSEGGVIVMPNGKDHYFRWKSRFELTSGDSTPQLIRAATTYRGVMSFLDFYAESERKR